MFPRVVNDGAEAFLGIIDKRIVFDKLLLFFGERHGVDNLPRVVRLASGAEAVSIGGMVNPFAISWLWRGLKGNSVTFALLFASLLLGWSISAETGHLLSRLGIHWLFVLILPGFLFMWLAKHENTFIRDESKRKLYARSLIVGSIILAIVIAKLRN